MTIHKTTPKIIFATLLIMLCQISWGAEPPSKNDFDLSNAVIDIDKIFQGGPPRDGIPSIDNPQFITVDEVDFLQDDDIIIGVINADQARAYPTRILVWHEIVNDTIADKKIAVTYCPLCGTAMVFDREAGNKTRQFGVSGLLYNSDVLLYDRETDSLWSQLGLKAVSGSAVGTTLTWLPSIHTTWAAWKQEHPNSQVLSTNTGHARNYNGNAYASYFASPETMFPVDENRTEFSNKTWVIGIIVNDKARAYPIEQFKNADNLQDEVGGQKINISYNQTTRRPTVTDDNGNAIASVLVFWFAWQAFYPDTSIWQPS